MRTRPLTPPLLALPFLAIACGGCAARTSVTAQAPSTTANGSIQRSKDAHDTDVADAKDTPPDQDALSDDAIVRATVAALTSDPTAQTNPIQVTSSGGVVTLSGVVDDRLAPRRAVAIAHVVRGVRAIIDRIDVRSFPATDAEIEGAVTSALRADPVTATAQVAARAHEGLVTLSGAVDSEAARLAVKDDARATPGVCDVVDDLSISPVQRSDAHVQDEVARRFHDDPWLLGAPIFAWVDGGVVHLRGKVAHFEQVVRAVQDARFAAPDAIDVSHLRLDGGIDSSVERRIVEPVFSDGEIAATLLSVYAMDPRVAPFSPKVDVNHGVIVVTGTAPSKDAARAAEEDAYNLSGAVKAENVVTVGSSPNVRLLREDPTISAVMRSQDWSVTDAAQAGHLQPSVATVPLPIREAHDQSVAVYAAARAGRWADATRRLEELAAPIRKIHDETVSDSASASRLDDLESSLTNAVNAKDRWMSMIQANELSGALAVIAAPYTPGVSADVHRLDYYGRALQIAEENRNPSEIHTLVVELRTRWERVRPELASRDADDAMRVDAAMTRMQNARSQPELARATEVELAAASSVRRSLQR